MNLQFKKLIQKMNQRGLRATTFAITKLEPYYGYSNSEVKSWSFSLLKAKAILFVIAFKSERKKS